MDVAGSAQVDAMAGRADDAVDTTMLRKALDQQSSEMAQLLQGLPQKDGTGTLVDLQM